MVFFYLFLCCIYLVTPNFLTIVNILFLIKNIRAWSLFFLQKKKHSLFFGSLLLNKISKYTLFILEKNVLLINNYGLEKNKFKSAKFKQAKLGWVQFKFKFLEKRCAFRFPNLPINYVLLDESNKFKIISMSIYYIQLK